MEFMRTCPSKYFSLAIIDPPYGIGMHNVVASGTTGTRVEKNGSVSKIARQPTRDKVWDASPPPQEYFDQLFRVSKNQIIWGGNHFVTKIKRDSNCWIIWNKKNGRTKQSDCELAWTSFDTTIRMFEYMWCGMIQEEQDKRFVEERIHPNQKPTKLYKYLLRNYAKAGDLILDTHVGSASSLIACVELGFDYIGFEIDRDYYVAASKRLSQATRKYELEFGG